MYHIFRVFLRVYMCVPASIIAMAIYKLLHNAAAKVISIFLPPPAIHFHCCDSLAVLARAERPGGGFRSREEQTKRQR